MPSSSNGGGATTDTLIHLVAGGAGGTCGAIVTCPLEVVKTRLQSSNSGFGSSFGSSGGTSQPPRVVPDIASEAVNRTTVPVTKPRTKFAPELPSFYRPAFGTSVGRAPAVLYTTGLCLSDHKTWNVVRSVSSYSPNPSPQQTMGVWQCLKFIIQQEGPSGLFRGLGPNLVGVAPSRAIYFWSYSTAKKNINGSLPKANRDTPFVHLLSAATAGFTASTVTNPIWLVKTRLQLDRATGENSLNVRRCVVSIYKQLGLSGFWKGVTASYWGISETMIHFVLYESFKKKLADYQNKNKHSEKTLIDFAGFMLCGACSKTCATCVAYPHEVARTRMREEGGKYRSFWQTLSVVYREEGRRGLYRGLATQLIRQIPNTAIMMSTYELTVYVLTRWAKGNKKEEELLRSSHSQ